MRMLTSLQGQGMFYILCKELPVQGGGRGKIPGTVGIDRLL